MKIKGRHIKNIYFLGIGGIGMSALARFYHLCGIGVCGYDKTATNITDELINEGISIHFEDNLDLIPEDIDMLIYTPAIPETLNEYIYLKKLDILIFKRSEALGYLSQGINTIAIAGTHGKTTITSIVAHIFKSATKDILAFIGGISTNYNSNIILSSEPELIIVEADEFDRSFLTLTPNIALISAIDADHLDIYGNKEKLKEAFEDFISKIKINGKLLYHYGLDIDSKEVLAYSYGFENDADYSIRNFEIKNHKYYFDLLASQKIEAIEFNFPGRHNVLNAAGAAAIALEYGLSPKQIKEALQTYKGVQRRFEYQIKTKDCIYIDDYAHHPEELKQCISSVKELYPNRKICGIFQPHLYTRTRDFADEFARSLDLLDEVILLDIYPARELPIEGINSKYLLEKINLNKKYYISKNNLVEFLKNKESDIILTLGAGDIDCLVAPIKAMLLEKYDL